MSLADPENDAYAVAQVEFPAWRVAVRSDIGSMRSQMQDAWRVIDDVALAGDVPGFVVGVFDGLGGVPNGGLAARTAAQSLEAWLKVGEFGDDVIGALNRAVLETRGATTAAMLGLPREGTAAASSMAVVRTIGDSSVYVREEEGAIQRVNVRDSVSRHVLSDFLGHPEASGHVEHIALRPGTRFLVCSDGVDGVVAATDLDEVMAAPVAHIEEALSRLFESVFARGAPDNATAILVVPA